MLKLINANIVTLNPHRPLADELLIDKGRLRSLGAQPESWVNDQAEVIDLGGRYVLPGLTDAHIHLRKYALNLVKIDCETTTKQACLERVRKRAQITPPGEWILGHGWNQNVWPSGFGDRDDLDRAAPRNPVYLTAKSLHAGWANTSALERAGINASRPDPEGGKINRDAKGQPTGILFEKAVGLVEVHLPQPGVQESAQAIQKAQENLVKMGITGVHDFDRGICLSALQELKSRGDLEIRVLKQIHHSYLDEAVHIGLRTGLGDSRLKIGGVKFFADGALGPQTAALLAPYHSQPDNRGMLMHSPKELENQALLAVRHGLSLTIHAIGDRANRVALNIIEKARELETRHQIQPGRHRIEHVQLLHPEDLHRLGELDVIASMQPIHAVSDREMAQREWGKRCRYAYAWKTQLDHQAVLALGSDAPVESPHPFRGIHAAVSRRGQHGEPGPEGWIPEERISREDALRGYTTGPAWAAGWEQDSAPLKAGRWADLIVLDENPLTCELPRLLELLPSATMIGGKFVWRDF